MIHQLCVTRWSSSPYQFVIEIVSPLPCSSGLVRHTLLFVYLFKELIYFIGSLDKCLISVSNALIIIISRISNKVPFRVMGHNCIFSFSENTVPLHDKETV